MSTLSIHDIKEIKGRRIEKLTTRGYVRSFYAKDDDGKTFTINLFTQADSEVEARENLRIK